jgi:hypothetical protein
MTQQPETVAEWREGASYLSPVTRVLALGFYDGPTNGLLQCGANGPVYKFDLLDEVWDAEGQDLRVFSLAPVFSTALAQLAEAYANLLTPRWPVWAPIWSFPTASEQAAMEALTDQVLQQAGPVQWVIATRDLMGPIAAARAVTSENGSRITDWPHFLGLPGQSTFKG